jgi:error-prone DNA polymerase
VETPKRHYPAHFTCALLNAQPMGFYSASSLVRDSQKHGVEVRDVCVVSSNWDCTLEARDGEAEAPLATRQSASQRAKQTHALRLGFRQIKGLGEATGLRIEEARRSAPIRDLDDLVRRAKLRKDEVEALAEAGALEKVVRGRRQALWEAKAPRVGGLFDGLRVEEPTVHLPSLSAPEQLCLDYGRKGLSVKDHPVRHLRKRLNQLGAVTTIALEKVRQGSVISVAGLVLSRQRPATASGVVFITLEDETGIANLVLYERVFEKYRLAARNGGTLLVRGKVERYVTPPVPGATSGIASKPSVPIIHVIAEHLERLDVPGRGVKTRSRDFH